jgi:hypothetical protein
MFDIFAEGFYAESQRQDIRQHFVPRTLISAQQFLYRGPQHVGYRAAFRLTHVCQPAVIFVADTAEDRLCLRRATIHKMKAECQRWLEG